MKYANTYKKGQATKTSGFDIKNVNVDVTGAGTKAHTCEPASKPTTHEDMKLATIPYKK